MSFGGSSGSSSIAAATDVVLSNPVTGNYLGYNTATSKWQNSTPASALRVVAKSTSYTAANFDFIIGNATTAVFTITLPAAVSGGKVSVKKVDASVNAITVTPASGLIDNLASDSVTVQWQSQDYLSDGTNWYRI